MISEVSLLDGSFSHAKSASLGGDCLEEKPAKLRWIRPDDLGKIKPVTFITDMYINEILRVPYTSALMEDRIRKIAWLIEPPSLSTTHYDRVQTYAHIFDYFLTFHKELIKKNDNRWLYYPLGGSWIAEKEWGVFEKYKMASMIASFKAKAEGHLLRHEAAKLASVFDIDVMGSGYYQIASKIEGLRPYCYSIVIESIRLPGYFSEKIIDCFSQGTIPIYWGDPDIGNFFNLGGIIRFSTVDELATILMNIVNYRDYLERMPSIHENLTLARQYRCAEDWIVEHHPFLFED